MNPLFLTILCGLASWRLASLLHTEDAFEWLRKWIGIGNDDEGYPAIYPETALPIVVTVVLFERMSLIYAILMWLGASSVAVWLEKQIMRTQSR